MNVNMFGIDKSGNWVPMLVDSEGTLTQPISPIWVYTAASGGITDTADVVLVAAGGAGNVNYLSQLQIHNAHASVATEVVIKDGSTVIWRGYYPAAQPGSPPINFDRPLRSSTNAALNAACITTGSKVYINAQGYQTLSVAQIDAQRSITEEIFDDVGVLILADDSTILTLN